jgi:hypothetical protein
MTFHIRLVSPPDLTEQLVDVLLADSGVSNLVVLAGSARRPDGDAVQFDVLARSANFVLRQLEALQDGRRGSITIESVDAAIGEQATPPPRHRLVQRDIAPVWDIVEAKIRSDAVYAPSFYILLAIAGLIGAVGILTNSQILIVGAMVVGPEYNAIMGIALGIDKRDKPPVRLRPARRVHVRGHRDANLRAGDPLVRPHAHGVLARRAPGLEPDRQPEPVFPDRRRPGRDRRRRVPDRSTLSRPHRRLHLRHDNPGSR